MAAARDYLYYLALCGLVRRLSNYLHWLDLVRDCSYKEYLALSGTRPDTAMRGPPRDNTGDGSSAEERQQLQGHNENFDSRIVQDAHHLGQVLPVQRLQAV